MFTDQIELKDIPKADAEFVDLLKRVVNVSVVVPQPSALLQRAVRYAADRDVLIVAAAGNDAQHGNPHEYPAAYPGVLAVGVLSMFARPDPSAGPDAHWLDK